MMYARVLIDNIVKESERNAAECAVDEATKESVETGCGLTGEWGLSIYIEHGGRKYLLDAGTTGKFAENAKLLGVDLAEVDCCVLSHAHYDHADGFGAFFAINEKAPLYIREGAGENCYHYYPIFKRYIGIKKGYLKKYAGRIRFAAGDFSLLTDGAGVANDVMSTESGRDLANGTASIAGVWLIPHKSPGLDAIGKAADMCVKKRFRYYPDDFSHEQSFVFDTEKGLVIFNSCSHGGADNIIREIASTFPDKKIYALIGGLHLYRSSDEKIRALAERVRATGIQKIYTGHCTGKHAFQVLKDELGDVVEQLYTGLEMEF